MKIINYTDITNLTLQELHTKAIKNIETLRNTEHIKYISDITY